MTVFRYQINIDIYINHEKLKVDIPQYQEQQQY